MTGTLRETRKDGRDAHHLYIDADACPVMQEIYRVAERHAGKGVAQNVYVFSNSPIAAGNILSRPHHQRR